MDKIKRAMPIVWAVLAVLAAFVFCAGMTYRCSNTFSNEDFIRFHVIANSDSEEDQALKLKVRDRLIEVVNEELKREAVRLSDGNGQTAQLDIEETRTYILEHIGEIESEAGKIIREEGYDYPVRAQLGVRFIPEKAYGSLTFPAGNYEALNITIGEGKGQNWWCVLYPPLCLIDAKQNKEEADQVLRDAVMQGKYSQLYDAAHGKKTTSLKLRFKTLELLEK